MVEASWLAGCGLVGWLAGWLAGWLYISWLAGWLAGWRARDGWPSLRTTAAALFVTGGVNCFEVWVHQDEWGATT